MSSINEITKQLFKRRLNEAVKNYSNMDTEELVQLAQEGDSYAFEEIVNTHQDFLRIMTAKYFTTSNDSDRDDLMQIAQIGLWQAVNQYDPNTSGEFQAFAGMIIKRRLTDELRREAAGKVEINTTATSLDNVGTGEDDSPADTGKVSTGDIVKSKYLTPEEELMGKEGAQEMMQFMKDNFSAKELDVVMRYIDGMTIPEIAEAMDVKYKSIENTLMRIRGKLNNYIKSSYKESEELDEADGLHFTEKEKSALRSILTSL